MLEWDFKKRFSIDESMKFFKKNFLFFEEHKNQRLKNKIKRLVEEMNL
jgi:hypothetical protein